MRRRTTPRPALGSPDGWRSPCWSSSPSWPSPTPAVHPASYSLVALDDAKAVDFDDGIVWFLVLGSDAGTVRTSRSGRADAIELVGLDFDTGRARRRGRAPGLLDRASPATVSAGSTQPCPLGGPELVADAVESLVGITPDYVFTTGFEGFVVDGRQHRPGSRRLPLRLPAARRYPSPCARGLNRMDGEEAPRFARAREPLPRSDFDRIANQHR